MELGAFNRGCEATENISISYFSFYIKQVEAFDLSSGCFNEHFESYHAGEISKS